MTHGKSPSLRLCVGLRQTKRWHYAVWLTHPYGTHQQQPELYRLWEVGWCIKDCRKIWVRSFSGPNLWWCTSHIHAWYTSTYCADFGMSCLWHRSWLPHKKFSDTWWYHWSMLQDMLISSHDSTNVSHLCDPVRMCLFWSPLGNVHGSILWFSCFVVAVRLSVPV